MSENKRKTDWNNGSFKQWLDRKTVILILTIGFGSTAGSITVSFLTPFEAEKRLNKIEQRLIYEKELNEYKEKQIEEQLKDIQQDIRILNQKIDKLLTERN